MFFGFSKMNKSWTKQKALHKPTFVLFSRRSKVELKAREWVSAGIRVGAYVAYAFCA
jgi:hypothetical protein